MLHAEVDEGRQLVCVDVTKNTRFKLRECDEQVVEKAYSFF